MQVMKYRVGELGQFRYTATTARTYEAETTRNIIFVL